MADYPDPKKIFAIFNNFIMATGKSKRNNELGDFPTTFGAIEWRRLYQAVDPDDLGYQAIDHWDASELPNGGTGTMWCFTELQLKPDGKFHRKTESGHTWEGKTGRQKPNGYPDDINVAKFILDKQFHMLEFTLKADTNKQHTVALCKIWRGGNSAAPSPQIPSPSASTWSPQTPSPQTPWDPSGFFSHGASTSHKVLENYWDNTGGVTDMKIDHPQGQTQSTAQQDFPGCSSLASSQNILLPQNPTRGLFDQSIGQGDESTAYQTQQCVENISFYDGLRFDITKIFESLAVLDSTKGSFGEVASKYPDEAHKIVSMIQDLASYYGKVPGATRPSTSWNNAQLMEAAEVISSAASANLEVATTTGDPAGGTAAAQDDVFPAADEEAADPMQEDCFAMAGSLFDDEWEFLTFDNEGNGNSSPFG